jgi:hypothetical protein
MSTFPTLKTGAVMQYPAQRGLQFSTTALQFVDGSEQRFCNYQSVLRSWAIQLSLLDQSELHELQEFFRDIVGRPETSLSRTHWTARIIQAAAWLAIAWRLCWWANGPARLR